MQLYLRARVISQKRLSSHHPNIGLILLCLAAGEDIGGIGTQFVAILDQRGALRSDAASHGENESGCGP